MVEDLPTSSSMTTESDKNDDETPSENVLGLRGGRVAKHHRRSEEMQAYLDKLKELVPYMPKDRKLSQLDVIYNVIDYICDLQQALHASRRLPRRRHNHSRAPLCVISEPNRRRTEGACSEEESSSKRSSPPCRST